MTTMSTPPTQFLELLNSIQKDFISNNSRAKIKHRSITADYKEGGYRYMYLKKAWYLKTYKDTNSSKDFEKLH